MPPEGDVVFEKDVFLRPKAKAKALKAPPKPAPEPASGPKPAPGPVPAGPDRPAPQPSGGAIPEPEPPKGETDRRFKISGNISLEIWNRLGSKILPKLRSGAGLKVGVSFTVSVASGLSNGFEAETFRVDPRFFNDTPFIVNAVKDEKRLRTQAQESQE